MTATLHRPLAREFLGTATAFGAGLLLPMLVHLIPITSGSPAGARLLPIFFAPLAAGLRLSSAAAIVTAAGSPLLNHLVTGRPAGALLERIELELIVFTLLALVSRRLPHHHVAWIAPAAYLASAALIALILPPHAAPWITATEAWRTAWPGLAALAALGFVLGRRGGE